MLLDKNKIVRSEAYNRDPAESDETKQNSPEEAEQLESVAPEYKRELNIGSHLNQAIEQLEIAETRQQVTPEKENAVPETPTASSGQQEQVSRVLEKMLNHAANLTNSAEANRLLNESQLLSESSEQALL